MSDTISHEDRQQQQLHMRQKDLPPAQEPEVFNRLQSHNASNRNLKGEFLLKLVPRVDVVLSACLNTVNDVVDEHRTLIIGGEERSLYRPLSRKEQGVAIQPLTDLYQYVTEIAANEYVVFGTDKDHAERVSALVELLNQHMKASFAGSAYENENGDSEFAISQRDYFQTSIHVSDVERGTVNVVYLSIRVIIHAASLTKGNADPETAVKNFNGSYRTVVKNFANATGIETGVHVAFDVSNFTVRPQLLSLFTALCGEEQTSVEAVNPQHYHGANTLVSVVLSTKALKNG
ncbi:hypothetical protein LU11_gp162 [Pseudomonas phage Lu11]|uniref:hypothetical protein n=1 Tax=Pseudomonas phage Lu11 TaxID=1161927 RepID=UPI00025F17C7|nr:hypothetical protein LU11_gp162 [Pseudomonas phage Lu11]AFH14693.1 hypothetical protein Lu11_0159 [Pseudomonas phage Lu11]